MLNIRPDEPLAVVAVDAIHSGDLESLKRLLRENPSLATARIRATRTLLHLATDWPGHFPNGRATVATLIVAGQPAERADVGYAGLGGRQVVLPDSGASHRDRTVGRGTCSFQLEFSSSHSSESTPESSPEPAGCGPPASAPSRTCAIAGGALRRRSPAPPLPAPAGGRGSSWPGRVIS